jgi:hypothetical protein
MVLSTDEMNTWWKTRRKAEMRRDDDGGASGKGPLIAAIGLCAPLPRESFLSSCAIFMQHIRDDRTASGAL